MKRVIFFICLYLFTAVSFVFADSIYVVPTFQSVWGSFYTKLSVNNEVPFLIRIDTGSRALVVPGNSLVCPSCHSKYGVTPTGKLGRPFHISYSGGRKLIARYSLATVQLTPAKNDFMGNFPPAVSQPVALIVKTNGGSLPMLGMAQPPITSAANKTTFMTALKNANVVQSKEFMLVGCPISQKGKTELVLGGIDPRLSSVMPLTIPILHNKENFYITPVTLGVVHVRHWIGKFDLPQTQGVVSVDSGTPEIILPTRLFIPLVRALDKIVSMPKSFWMGKPGFLTQQQLMQLPALIIGFKNGIKLTIPASSYVFPDPRNRRLSLLRIKNGGAKAYTCLGTPLFTAYAIAFDRASESLRFYSNRAIC